MAGIVQMNARHVLWRSNSRHLLSVHIAKHRMKLTAARLQDATAETLNSILQYLLSLGKYYSSDSCFGISELHTYQ